VVEVCTQCIKKPPGDANTHSRGAQLPLTERKESQTQPQETNTYSKNTEIIKLWYYILNKIITERAKYRHFYD
jgi:hypothetical protein